MARALLRLAVVTALGVLVAVGVYSVFFLGGPSPREAREWELLAVLPTARGETAAAEVDGKLYVAGGYTGLTFAVSDEVDAYDPATNTWTVLAPLPAPRNHAAAAGLDGLLYVSGGGGPSDNAPEANLWAFDPGGRVWTELAPMPEARFAHRMAALDGLLYVVGGQGATGAVMIYDPATDAWSTGAEMPLPRNHLAAVAVDGRIWAIGGRVGGRSVDRVDIYDPGTDSWAAGLPLPGATSAASEGVLGSVIVISGGEEPGENGRVVDDHWQLDTAVGLGAQQWRPLAPPPLAVHGAQGAVVDGRFMIAGGASRQGQFSRFAWSGLLQAYTPGVGD
jgi:N-acetylneuraminic acid mutarotase